MVRTLLETAIARLGSQARLAGACGVTQASVWQAKQVGRVSAELALLIERATGGEITARELRPDLPWPDLSRSGLPRADPRPGRDAPQERAAS